MGRCLLEAFYQILDSDSHIPCFYPIVAFVEVVIVVCDCSVSSAMVLSLRHDLQSIARAGCPSLEKASRLSLCEHVRSNEENSIIVIPGPTDFTSKATHCRGRHCRQQWPSLFAVISEGRLHFVSPALNKPPFDPYSRIRDDDVYTV